MRYALFIDIGQDIDISAIDLADPVTRDLAVRTDDAGPLLPLRVGRVAVCLSFLTAAFWASGLTVALAVAAPKPTLGRTVVVEAVGGTVLVKKGVARRFVRLPRIPIVVPTGSTIDATRGRVRLTSATGRSNVMNSGVFYDGAFKVSQVRSKNGLTDLQLLGGTTRACGVPARSGEATARVAISAAVIRLLRAKAHGHFRTVGRYGAATVRGTVWLTEDRCNGTTYIADQRGSVATSDPNNDLNLRALSLGPGDSALWYCNDSGQPPVSRKFCTATVSSTTNNLIAAGILNFGPSTSYDLCITEPSSAVGCISALPFSGRQANGSRISFVVCTPFAGQGTYSFSWRVSDVFLGPPLPASARKASSVRQCDRFPGAESVQPPT